MADIVYVVGLGPGDPQFLTAQAQSALTQAEVLCGYTVYLDLVRPYFPDKLYYSTGMTKEIDRCRWALETARSGRAVALVCSGDAGVYGMASPLLELAESITETLVGEEKTDVSMEKVQQSVCEYFNISREDLVSKSRKRQIVQARQIAMYLCRTLISNCSLASIGAEIGGKDHATVLHSCMTVSDLMSTDKVFRKYVDDIERMLTPSSESE